jgi:phosphoribosylformimino-5-aminoimidazole carboxamide ribotide isomerase
VEAILNATTVPVQLGGGIRDMAGIETWLERGVTRVILGTAAVREPDFVKQAAKRFEGQVVVGIDARDGMVAVEGWAETSNIDAISLAKQFQDAGVAAIVYTDIGRDGALTGLNLDATVKLADTVSIPVIASGGLASMADVDALIEEGAFVEGAIAGRALYDGRLDAKMAIAKINAYNAEKA